MAGAVLSLGGLLSRQGQGVAPGRLPSSSNSPGGQVCPRGTHLTTAERMFVYLLSYIQSLFLEQVLDTSLHHSSTDLAKPRVMSVCARREQWQSLSLSPWLHPNLLWVYPVITALPLLVIALTWL